MARRKDLAGLAALGALGMLLSQKQDGSRVPVEDRGSSPEVSPSRDTRDYGVDYSEAPQRGRDLMTEAEPGWTSATAPVRRPASGARTSARPVGDDQYNPDVRQGRIAGQGGPRGTRYSETDTGDDVKRMANRSYSAAQDRANSAEGRAAMQARAESQALTPIRPEEFVIGGGGLGGVKAAAAAAKNLAGASKPARTAAQQAWDRAQMAERLTPVRGSASKAATESELRATGNPLEWASGRNSELYKPKALSEADWAGGAVGYKKGGKVKKMASGGSVKASASRRGDGIAQRGKTRGKMV